MLALTTLTPAQTVAADAALRRLKPTADQLATFQKQLAKLFKHLDPTKIERHGETHILDFLRDTTPALGPGPAAERYGNVNGKRDLALHLGDTAASPVGVIIEVKGPKNPQEMLAPGDLNRKAFQQLLLYYLEDRADDRADDFRRLVVTTGYEWYIFDAQDFDALFWKNAELRRAFKDFKNKAKASPDTHFFYKNIAGKFLSTTTGSLRATYVDLRPGVPTAPAALTDLWRVFGPGFLLKEFPSQRPDANTLNQEFYAELLYLMGLQETAVGGVRRIGRCAEGTRQAGSLLENILYQMDIGHDLGRVPAELLAEYGPDPARQREEVALALCLVWVNRLLFLKLLEAQLVHYHPAAHAQDFRFLTPARLPEYDELNKLFFGVLNRPPGQRPADVRAAFRELPYLNSSLFQPAPLEETVLYVRELSDRAGLAPFPQSVLRRKTASTPPLAPDAPGQWLALPYLLGFLDAFDFGSDPSAGPAAGPGEAAPAKPLLSAAVLGLVFEKINGYRDGSFYTPGFVTMYMARHTLRRAVVRRFTQGEGGRRFPELAGCTSWEELRDAFSKKRKPEYAGWFNGLTVLDPAVGSGHFLVSALNELLALKADLRLLLDADGQLLDYTLRVEHDELLITDNDTDAPARYQVATYDPATGQRTVAAKYTRLQAALFREKRALMEHALFGVDLNPNSVRICRLRLWIELLKHAYYRPDSEFQDLETLPNLDLNVRTGNSLVSRHALDAPLGQVFRTAGITVERYKSLVHEYFGASGQVARQQLDATLAELKASVARRISQADPFAKKLADAELQILQLEKAQSDLFGKRLDEEGYATEHRKRTLLVEQRRRELADHRQGVFFQQAFEWRFEFPEVLDEDARFQGFDVVLGNPPYLIVEDEVSKKWLGKTYKFASGKPDLYRFFIERAYTLAAPNGEVAYIVPNSLLGIPAAKALRSFMLDEGGLKRIITFQGSVFPGASVNSIIFFGNAQQKSTAVAFAIQHPKQEGNFDGFLQTSEYNSNIVSVEVLRMDEDIKLTVVNDAENELVKQMDIHSKPLYELANYSLGIQVYHNTVHSKEEMDQRVAHASTQLNTDYVLEAGGRHIQRYGLKLPADSFVNYAAKAYQKPDKKFLSGPRIVLREITGDNLTATVVEQEVAFNKSVIIIRPFSPDLNLYFLLGVINSKSIGDYVATTGEKGKQKLFPRISLKTVKQLPIPTATAEQQAAVATLVAQILAARAADANADTRAAEAQIDALVAALYGLTPAEVAQLGGAGGG